MSARAAAASTKVRLGPGAAAFPAHSVLRYLRRGFPTAPPSPHRGGRGFNPLRSRRRGGGVGEAGRSLPAAFPAALLCCLPGGARRWPHPRPGPLPRRPPPPGLTCWSAGPGRDGLGGRALPPRAAPAGALAVPFCSRLEPGSN